VAGCKQKRGRYRTSDSVADGGPENGSLTALISVPVTYPVMQFLLFSSENRNSRGFSFWKQWHRSKKLKDFISLEKVLASVRMSKTADNITAFMTTSVHQFINVIP
jgi:hypothetical protein